MLNSKRSMTLGSKLRNSILCLLAIFVTTGAYACYSTLYLSCRPGSDTPTTIVCEDGTGYFWSYVRDVISTAGSKTYGCYSNGSQTVGCVTLADGVCTVHVFIGTVAILTALLTRSILHFTIELANRLRAEIPATIENEEKHCRRNCFLISGAIFTQRLFCFCGGNSPRRRIL